MSERHWSEQMHHQINPTEISAMTISTATFFFFLTLPSTTVPFHSFLFQLFYFKALFLEHKTITQMAPVSLPSLIQSPIPSQQLRSASETRLVVPPHHDTKSVARLFCCVVPRWWNDLLNSPFWRVLIHFQYQAEDSAVQGHFCTSLNSFALVYTYAQDPWLIMILLFLL